MLMQARCKFSRRPSAELRLRDSSQDKSMKTSHLWGVFIDSVSKLAYFAIEFWQEALHLPLNIAVFGSGRGSNFRAILTAMQQGRIPNATIVLVVSNNSTSGILEIACTNTIPALHLSEKQFSSVTEFEERLLATLALHKVNFIVLAGYMKRVPRSVVSAFRHRIINIHPALLPKFGGQGMYGMHVHEAVIAANEHFSGATVHFVDEEYDRGAIILQKQVVVEPRETPSSLAEKILAVEHEIYPEAIRLVASGEVVNPDMKHS
jgi:phosphoribosylglycinamide formyltransferase-1